MAITDDPCRPIYLFNNFVFFRGTFLYYNVIRSRKNSIIIVRSLVDWNAFRTSMKNEKCMTLSTSNAYTSDSTTHPNQLVLTIINGVSETNTCARARAITHTHRQSFAVHSIPRTELIPPLGRNIAIHEMEMNAIKWTVYMRMNVIARFRQSCPSAYVCSV